MSNDSFAPLSYAATLKSLRTLLVTWGGCADPSAYTLRSMKSTFLSWTAQVGVPEELRAKQGHNRQSSAQLYSRDDVFPQLRAQKLWWQAFKKGFRPLVPQHRGGQRPLQEPALPSDAGVFPPCALQLDLFNWDADAVDLGAELLPSPVCSFGPAPSGHLSPESSIPALDTVQQPPCLLDSDVEDLPEDSQETAPAAPPALQADAPANACSAVKYLKASSGVVHAAVRHPGTAKVCLLCHNASCSARLFPACGAIASVTAVASLSGECTCKRRACSLILEG